MGVVCSLTKEPQKTNKKTSHPRGSAKSRIWGAENRSIHNCACRVPSRT